MKKSALLVFFAFVLICCKDKAKEKSVSTTDAVPEQREKLYGADFMNVTTLNPDQVNDIYKNLSPGDTVNVTFKAPVKTVCKKKGCWMELEVGASAPVMVRFKDYGFFVPKDIENKEVTVNGRAFIAEVGVEELRHQAEDAGKDTTAVNAIDAPQRRLAFTADGVKIPQ